MPARTGAPISETRSFNDNIDHRLTTLKVSLETTHLIGAQDGVVDSEYTESAICTDLGLVSRWVVTCARRVASCAHTGTLRVPRTISYPHSVKFPRLVEPDVKSRFSE